MLPPNPVLQTVRLATRGSFRQRDKRKLVWASCEEYPAILPESRKFRKVLRGEGDEGEIASGTRGA
jgi:hypothetical protein